MTILEEILDHKRREIEESCERLPPAEMASRAQRTPHEPRGFRAALLSSEPPVIIAEIKRCSPSKGEIRADFEPTACASAYAEGGAAAISVLTDSKYFGGSNAFLEKIRTMVSIPLLRKDFVVDPYQVDEARIIGADAVLLIASALEPDDLQALHEHALDLGLDVLVEVHDEAELEIALATGAEMIGVNNRDLHTFDVDLGVTERLARRIPVSRGIALVAESGIYGPDDITRMQAAGATACLVGESLMRERDLAGALRRLRRSA